MHQPIVSSMAWLVSGALLGSFVFPFCPNECHLPSTETTAKLESELQTLLQKARHGQVRRDVLITTAAEHQKESSKILTRQLDVCGQNVQQLRTELAAAKKPYSECLQLPECRHQRNSPENAWYPQPLSNPLFLRGDIPTNPSNIEPDGISLATHLSADRLQALTQLCTTWPLNISAAVYAMDDADLEKVNDWCQSDTGCNCADTGTLNRIQLQVLKADQLSKSYRGLYPVNSLRNRALIGVRTKHTLGIDADFLVGGDVGNMPQPDDKTIYLLPCFKVEADKYPQGKPWPVTKAQLLEWYSNGWVSAYGEMKDWPLGHMDVNYSAWYGAASGALYPADAANIYFEPYFVGETKSLPLYDERYRGYGAGDKALHFHMMYKMGFDIKVLPDHYLLHIPHADNSWRGGKDGSSIGKFYNEFHGIDRMTSGVHQLDFWTRVVQNCLGQALCRESVCSLLAPQLSGGAMKCRTNPDRFFIPEA
eukprot:m.1036255 g.1036255  ORF g.1036255 m.1036255 type:complete len:479 (+) comp24139_c2_seq13:262-1698(+)